MPRKNKRINKTHRKKIKDGFFSFGMALHLDPKDSGFEDLEDARRWWEIHGDRYTEEHIKHRLGDRPFAWWVWTDKTGREKDLGLSKMRYLKKMGLLKPEEIEMVDRVLSWEEERKASIKAENESEKQ